MVLLLGTIKTAAAEAAAVVVVAIVVIHPSVRVEEVMEELVERKDLVEQVRIIRVEQLLILMVSLIFKMDM